MKVNFNWIAKIILNSALKKIADIPTYQIEEMVKKINTKVDVPVLNEKQEASMIRASLVGVVQTAKQLVDTL